MEKGYKTTYTVIGTEENISIVNVLKSEKWTVVKPFMEKEHLIKEYEKADIFVMPSVNETFGLVYAEAMTQGLPVIYSQGEGFDGQFLEGEVGFHVNCRDAVDVCDKIIMILNNYDNISKKCIEKATVFNWHDILRSYLC